MAFCVTRSPRGKDSRSDVPVKDDGLVYEWALHYSDGTKICWADSVEELVAVLAGEPGYFDMDEQERLVVRIRLAIRMQVVIQSRLVFAAQQNGDWETLTAGEREVLLSPRVEQPCDWEWSRSLFGTDLWTAPTPLVIVTTGYLDRPMPQGDPRVLWAIDPITSEDLLQTLCDTHVIDVYRAEDWC